MKTTIHLRKVFGAECLTAQDGKQLFDLLSKELKRNESVTIDCTGVDKFASPFFNASLGRLVERYRPRELLSRVNCAHMNEAAMATLQRVLTSADEYFRDDEHRRAVGETTNRLLSEN